MIVFHLIAAITLGSALAAVSLRNPVHCGFSVALAFAGAALVHIFLGAEFVGLVVLLVYVGAIAVLIMFVIFLTRPTEGGGFARRLTFARALTGAGTALLLFLLLVHVILASPSLCGAAPPAPQLPIDAIGQAMVGSHLGPLYIIGAFLTVALIGGVPLAFGKDEQ